MKVESPRVVLPETFMRKKGVNVYRCPICANVFRHDDEYEPVCTGPSWTDDHEPTVMTHVVVAPRQRTW